MSALDGIEKTLEEWGQNLRGGASVQGLQPRNVLHALLSSLEAERVEGLDHRIYAPNNFQVELHLTEAERSRLLPFVGREELEAAVLRYTQEKKYQFRGPLSVQVVEGSPNSADQALSETESAPQQHRAENEQRRIQVTSRFDVPAAEELPGQQRLTANIYPAPVEGSEQSAVETRPRQSF